MDQTRTMGQTIRHRTSTQYITGTNPHPANYRISTTSTGSSFESFDRGLSGLVNADASAITGSSSGQPSGYYCASSYYWNTWANKCADNIAMPDGFNFTYFGTDYNYTDSNDRINLGRHGNMHFVSSGSTALVRSMTTWYGNMPQLPYSSSSFARAGTIAPYWSYYGTYYCYQNSKRTIAVCTTEPCLSKARVQMSPPTLPKTPHGTQQTAQSGSTQAVITSPFRLI